MSRCHFCVVCIRFAMVCPPSPPPAGKGKLAADGGDAAADERPCLEVLLGLPARAISRRSEGHMNQSLEVCIDGGFN